MSKKTRTVTGVTDNSIFHVAKGKVCTVKREFWRNGEGWYTLVDAEGTTFESPDVFWQSEEDS